MDRFIDFNSNPVLGNGIYMADVEAHTFDGTLYLYGTSEGGARIISTKDMKTFTDHGMAVTADDVKWKKTSAVWAPECAYRNGIYYLYYSLPSGECGVSVSKTPYGPFENSVQIDGMTGIDPAVLIDDDGQAYIYYGQCNSALVAKLNADMISIDKESITSTFNAYDYQYHEGISVRKIEGKYYFVYTDTSRHGAMPVCQGYSVSEHPMYGFKYKGVLIDNFGCDPESWNNHGCIECLNGKWYIFYHCSTDNCCEKRQLFVEELKMDEKGDFSEAEMTSSGMFGEIAATERIPASLACILCGNVRKSFCENAEHKFVLSEIKEGDTAEYKYIAFNGETHFTVKTKSIKDGRVELYVDGRYHGCIMIKKSEEFRSFGSEIKPLFGKHKIELRFFGTPGWGNFDMMERLALSEIAFG